MEYFIKKIFFKLHLMIIRMFSAPHPPGGITEKESAMITFSSFILAHHLPPLHPPGIFLFQQL